MFDVVTNDCRRHDASAEGRDNECSHNSKDHFPSSAAGKEDDDEEERCGTAVDVVMMTKVF